MSSHLTAEVASRSSSQPRRRQNTSCDPCRRSKRRCFFPSDGLDDLRDTCAHCRRLGHACTFNFAASRQTLRPQRRQRRNPPRSDRNGDHNGSFNLPVYSTEQISQIGLLDAQDDFAAWFNFDNEQSFSQAAGSPMTGDLSVRESTTSCLEPTGMSECGNERQIAPLPDCLLRRQSFQHRADAILGSAIRSPVHLLNSKMDARMLDESSIRIFDTIVTGSANRFLDYECNLYAAGARYQIENSSSGNSQGASPVNWETLNDGLATVSTITSPKSAELSIIPAQDSTEAMTRTRESQEEDNLKMTLLGCARFLDHFGGLYGNQLSRSDRKKSDIALTSAFRAFSFQWLSKEKVGWGQTARNAFLDIYTDAWHQARSSLNDAHSVRSFRVVFASFMFDGIATPISARPHFTAHEYLDSGLQKLDDLEGLVKQYCTTLGPLSRYTALIEASLSLIRWCGYLRETGAALFGDYQCKAHYPLVNLDSDNSTPSYSTYRTMEDLDMKIPAICRKASAEAFYIWAKMIAVKRALPKATDSSLRPSPRLSESIADTMLAIEKFEKSFRHFLTKCRETFHDFSIPSKIASVSLMAFWNLGVLTFAEILQPLENTAIPDPHPTMQSYRQVATSSMAEFIECVLQLPVEEAFNLQNGLSADVPLIAYHVTPSLMVTALEKAIEHIIDMQTSHNEKEMRLGTSWDSCDETWTRHIDCLMKGLLSLDITVGGSQTAGVAFESLMRKHGDIISECWTSDFET
ncbi:hypothetical protein N7523_003924 [Penicillium sp. IBT 18751x]|nr:hypothetical protein N7523_003924 [Penicillium sp. IBT 18751x]